MRSRFLPCVVCVAVLVMVSACQPIMPQEVGTPTAEEMVPDTPTGIEGIVWQWVSTTDQTTSTAEEVPNPELYTLVLSAGGTVTGQADCNTYFGSYSQEAGFEITVEGTTAAACGDGSLETQYLDLLNQVVAGGPDGAGGLALETAGGAQRMMFRNGGQADTP